MSETNPNPKSILKESHDYEAHETPEHKVKWDENKLKKTDDQKKQVTMKVDEPNTPYIRYDAVTDKVTNWEVLPENIRKAAQEEPDDFSLNADDSSNSKKAVPVTTSFQLGSSNKSNQQGDEWDKIDEEEKQKEEEAALERHKKFEKNRAQHYKHAGDVMHQKMDVNKVIEEDNNKAIEDDDDKDKD